jgi:nucleotidyltransferase substrate binding protein (TIGR01987 family)
MERLTQKLSVAKKALKTLNEILKDKQRTDIHRDAAIQRFEYTFEAVWKVGQAFLREHEGIETGSPKAVFRAFFQTGYFKETQTQLALTMVDDRNLTSHTYNEALSDQIFDTLPAYASLMRFCLSSMKKALATNKIGPKER